MGMTAATGYGNLVDANHAAGQACITNSGITKRVVANDRMNSLVLRKLQGTQHPTCGNRMPPATTGMVLPPHELIGISTWIAVGAPNN
jgi:hypothetical protein